LLYKTQELSSAYGEDLMQNGQCHEAGLMFSRAGKCERALTAFEDCLQWRHAVMMAAQLNFTDAQLNQLARRLASESVSTVRQLLSLSLLGIYPVYAE